MTENEIARLIDGRSRDEADARLWRHLKSCEQCFSVYREAAVYRGIWDSERRAFAPTEELIAAGLQIASGGGADRGLERNPRRRFWFRRGHQYVASAAAAVAAVFLIWYLSSDIRKPSAVAPADAMYAPVKRAVEEVTKRGAFVLPGGEGAITADNGFSYRSGYIPLEGELKASLDEMFEAYRGGDRSEDLIYWLIAGHVATGQMKTAREIAGHARKLGIETPRIIIVDAIVVYALGNVTRAKNLLRNLLDTYPGNCLARINLAALLLEQGETSEARYILDRFAETCPDTHLHTRAHTLQKIN